MLSYVLPAVLQALQSLEQTAAAVAAEAAALHECFAEQSKAAAMAELLQQLNSTDTKTQLAAARLLASCSSMDRTEAAGLMTAEGAVTVDDVIAADGLPQCLQQLTTSSSADVQIAVCRLLTGIAFSKPIALAAAGAIPTLLALVKDSCGSNSRSSVEPNSSNSVEPNSSSLVQESVCQVLAALAGLNPQLMASSGGIPQIVRMLDSKQTLTRQMACTALAMITIEPAHRQPAVAARAVPLVAKLLLEVCSSSHCGGASSNSQAPSQHAAQQQATGVQGSGSGAALLSSSVAAGPEALQVACASIIRNLGSDGSVGAAFTAAGVMQPLVQLLSSTNIDVQKSALMAVVNISGDTAAQATALVAAGGVPPLLGLL